MGVVQWNNNDSTPTLIKLLAIRLGRPKTIAKSLVITLTLVRGCCRFSGFTTTAYPLRVHGGGN